MLMLVIILLALTLAGAGMLLVGARGLVTKRVTIYSGKWLLALVAICFFPQFINGLSLIASVPTLALINLVLYPGVLLIFWYATKGYIIFGVSEETANEALKSAFTKLGTPHEQLLGSIRLEDGAIFQVSMQDWVGTMQIKPKNKEAGARTPALIAALREHFGTSAAGARTMPYWIYAFCGGLLFASLLVLAGLMFTRPRKSPVRQAPAGGTAVYRPGAAPTVAV